MSHLHLAYIGSKRTLFPVLDTVFREHITPTTVFGDLFAGTGSVAYMVQQRYRCPVITNDTQTYAYVLNRAILSRYSASEQELITRKIDEYNALEGEDGFMATHYAPPARMYFTRENARRIDAIRIALEADRRSLPVRAYYYLLASLLVAADRVANTSSVYAAYLKTFKKTATQPLLLPAPEFPQGILPRNRHFQQDVRTMPADVAYDVVYLDPPYNGRQYSTYYHILETIARYDDPAIHGQTGLRDDSYRSPFSTVSGAEEAFRQLVATLSPRTRVLICSYNDEGLLAQEKLQEILSAHGPVTVQKIPYKKFKAQQGVDRKQLFEYIFVSSKPDGGGI